MPWNRLSVSTPRSHELERCAELMRAAAAWVAEEHPPAMWQDEELVLERLLSTYVPHEFRLAWLPPEPSPVAAFVLQGDDRLFWPDAVPGEALYLHKLAVARPHAGRDILTPILDHAMRETVTQRRRYLRLDTPVDRERLRSLYERHGFVAVGRRVVGAHDVVLYERPVT